MIGRERRAPAGLSAETALVARGSLVNLGAMVTGAALSFGLTVLVSRWLQPAGAGALFELIALFIILSNTFELGADTGLTRWISRARAIGGLADVRWVVMIALVPVLLIGAGVAAVLWVQAPELAHLFLRGLPPADGTADVRILAPLVPLGALSMCLVDGARGFGRMWPYLVIEGLGKPAARISMVLAALVLGWGLRGAIVGWGLPVIGGLAASLLIFGGILKAEVPFRTAGPGSRGRRRQPSRHARRDAPQIAGTEQFCTPSERPAASGQADSGQADSGQAGPGPADSRPGDDGPPDAGPGDAGPGADPGRRASAELPATAEFAITAELPVILDDPVPADLPARGYLGSHGSGRHRGPPDRRRRRLTAEFWRFTAPRAFQGTFQVVILWLDILLVGVIVSRYAAGVYAAVSKLAIVGTFALEGNRLAIGPQLSAMLARREYDRAADLYQSATRWLMLASWPLYLVFAIFPAVVLGIFGTRYTAGAAALVVLSLAMLVNLGTGNVTVVLLMGGKSSWSAINAGAALAVNVVLNLVLLPHIGIAGAAIAWAASIVVDNVAAMIEVRWVLGLAPFGTGYGLVAATTAGCFGVTGIAARALLGETLPALVLALAVGVAAFAAVLYLGRAPLRLTGMSGVLRLRTASAATSRAGQRAA